MKTSPTYQNRVPWISSWSLRSQSWGIFLNTSVMSRSRTFKKLKVSSWSWELNFLVLSQSQILTSHEHFCSYRPGQRRHRTGSPSRDMTSERRPVNRHVTDVITPVQGTALGAAAKGWLATTLPYPPVSKLQSHCHLKMTAHWRDRPDASATVAAVCVELSRHPPPTLHILATMNK